MHLHLSPSLHDHFLRAVVAPLLRAEGLYEHFFFLRYWQGGPHIRLRMRTGPDAAPAVDRVLAGLAEAMPEFAEQAREEYELGLAHQAELARLEGEVTGDARAVGTLDPAAYEPEYGKYGGVDGVASAEILFRETSAAVLDLLVAQNTPVGTRRAPIGEAARIMAMFLHGAGLDPEAAKVFLQQYEDYWSKWAPEEMRRAWPKLYQGVSAQLTQLCASVWLRGATADVFHDISAGAAARARSLCGAAPDADVRQLSLDGTPYLSCLSNYIHTTNNRLGLVPASEGLVAYIVRRGLEEAIGQ
ncbi:lantibiotic dehydratase C-terminal domain-containing protein [Allokutzneria multivorans]|uniref:lantibiotic dehydratase C-terminal domain-containing protein n=1 Tax=Allokutzneria multivorans TaxID=1142134 RepID=UPI0031E6FD7D